MSNRYQGFTILVVAAVYVSLGYSSSAHGQIQEVKVEVKGLSCPFCVKGVEKHLNKIDGVTDVSTSLKKGVATLRYDANALFDAKRIETAVVRGGFTPGALQLRARGKVIKGDKNFLFAVKGMDESFVIGLPEASKENKAGNLNPGEAKKTLAEAAATGGDLELSGTIARRDGEPSILYLTRAIKVPVKEKGNE